MFLPVDSAVEIGCGYGRVSSYLASYCDRLSLFDISQACVDRCNELFLDSAEINASLTDGKSLPAVSDHSTDLLFSIHSLVQADAVTMQAYIAEASRVLSVDGVAFLHHSNSAVYSNDPAIDQAAIADYRDTTVSAQLVMEWAQREGLRCIRQELVNWGLDSLLSDCFSILVRKQGAWQQRYELWSNPDFYREMQYLRRMSDHYQTIEKGTEGGT
jgi:ubiquinone/menaquinone biosynthesis C-methylase UbiE